MFLLVIALEDHILTTLVLVDVETEYLNFICNFTLVEELQAVKVGKHGASLGCLSVCRRLPTKWIRTNAVEWITILAHSKAVQEFCDLLGALTCRLLFL